jgi:hypothetical protein
MVDKRRLLLLLGMFRGLNASTNYILANRFHKLLEPWLSLIDI